MENNSKLTSSIHSFRAKSHILSLLGDELIGSDNLAVFELVKNAYDADAEEVVVALRDLNTAFQSIEIEDDGCGMDLDTIQNVWLEIGTDFKRGKRRKKSDKYGRVSLGEKGVGRLAVHKLGHHIILETKKQNSEYAYRISFNWPKLIENAEYIEDTKVSIDTVVEDIFRKGHGTRIIISELKKKVWERRDLRELARKINSIKSPFREIENFDIKVKANDGHQSWFEDVKSPEEILRNALYYFDFEIRKNDVDNTAVFIWSYSFNPPKHFNLRRNADEKKLEDKFTLPINSKVQQGLVKVDQKHLSNEDLNLIGEFTGRYYVYNLLAPVINGFGQSNTIKSFVKENSGVKIFRDGIRVYNYGEPFDDWLGLDLARIQKLGEHFSKNTVVGAIELSLGSSNEGLKEKTNREGFDENFYYQKFKFINNQIFDFFERIAQPDREKIKHFLENVKPIQRVGLSDTIRELEDKLKSKNLDKELSPLLRRVEKDYNDMRDVMLNSGMSGMNLSLVFHELDREIKFINSDLKSDSNIENVKTRVKNLIELLENFSPLLKQNQNIKVSASQLVKRAFQINSGRFKHHKVIFSSPLVSGESPDFNITGPGNLLISSLSNIIDNAIYWLENKRELDEGFKSAICITSDMVNFSGPAIIIADNGDGFNLSPEDLILPFRTTRPGGMGLGLYFVNIVMETIGGQLLFPELSETPLNEVYNGAKIALVFNKN